MLPLVDPSELPALLCTRAPLIDVRAEIEFERATIPQSISAPLLHTDERARVGTIYREQGLDAAVALGNRLVQGEEKERRIATWQRIVREQGAVALYCARGGLRSEISQRWLAEAGTQLPRVKGGYKQIRALLTTRFAGLMSTRPFLVVAGMTGTGKSSLLREDGIAALAIDLERIAQHFGSAFGALIGSQPTQGSFENQLYLRGSEILLDGPSAGGSPPVLVEDESRRIGKVMLPLELYELMSRSSRVEIVLSVEQRVQQIIHDYIDETIALRSDEPIELVCDSLAEFFKAAVTRLRKRLGDERARRLIGCIDDAAARHRVTGDSSFHHSWIEPLLREYYDPLYEWDLSKKRSTIVFEGGTEEVRQYLRHRSARA